MTEPRYQQGFTINELDKEQLAYLTSKGIKKIDVLRAGIAYYHEKLAKIQPKPSKYSSL